MKTRVLASTKLGYELPIEEAIRLSSYEAGICYMKDTIDQILAEPEENTKKRANGNMISNHHSVFGHPKYCFVFEGIPKIMAMILNNEKVYDTSEKSARFTKMEPSEEEKVLYEKWLGIYQKRISQVYPDIKEGQVIKLAQENARYLISVFTPATTMGYTVSFQQFSYILYLMESFLQKEEEMEFKKLLAPYLGEFIEAHSKYKIDGISPKSKNRALSLFAHRIREEEWGEQYCYNYWASFSQLAQAQRHRTLKYEILIDSLDSKRYGEWYYVPPIIRETEWHKEWVKDISSLSKYFPQGRMIWVNERGTAEDFIQKCKERLCGCAQLETAMRTKETLDLYIRKTKNEDIRKYLMEYATGARCTFPDYNCNKPCIWGAKGALTRLV